MNMSTLSDAKLGHSYVCLLLADMSKDIFAIKPKSKLSYLLVQKSFHK